MTNSASVPSTPSGVEIVLDDVVKRFPGQERPAVDHISLTLQAGEITVFVGPSGCGKTTTMRMINRLIEPSSGLITINGKDNSTFNAAELRRSIGYSIQQSGLFPHMTVAQNIATVPRLLKWDRKKTTDRVDEMLDTVGLDPGQFRDRYPRQLSGGQQQRIGVARALAADPPVLLMDEPFGAVDPITRGSLQDELMRLQAELRKTIVFVTHDFTEAIKLGDRIAVLGSPSTLLQYDTPSAILANPADETVAGFVGHDAALQQLTLMRVRELNLADVPVAIETDPAQSLAQQMDAMDEPWGVILDIRGRPARWVNRKNLGSGDLTEAGQAIGETVSAASTLQDALEALLAEASATTVVTGNRGEYLGVVTIEDLVGKIRELRATDGGDRGKK